MSASVPTGAYHTWNGTTLEGMPIEPDEQIGFGWRKRRAGIDEQFEYAVSGLGTKMHGGSGDLEIICEE